LRHYIRHPFEIPIKYKTDEQGRIHKDDLQDISEGGLSFQAEEPIVEGTEIIVNISVNYPPFEAKGVVKWCKEEGGHYTVGVQFDSPTIEFSLRMVEQVCYIEQYRKDVKLYEQRELSSEEAAREWIKKFGDKFPN